MNDTEIVAYEKQIKFVAIDQLTQSGWVDLIRIPIDNPDSVTADQIQTSIENMSDVFYKSKDVHLSVQGKTVVVKNTNGGTFRVYASIDQRVWDCTKNHGEMRVTP